MIFGLLKPVCDSMIPHLAGVTAQPLQPQPEQQLQRLTCRFQSRHRLSWQEGKVKPGSVTTHRALGQPLPSPHRTAPGTWLQPSSRLTCSTTTCPAAFLLPSPIRLPENEKTAPKNGLAVTWLCSPQGRFCPPKTHALIDGFGTGLFPSVLALTQEIHNPVYY